MFRSSLSEAAPVASIAQAWFQTFLKGWNRRSVRADGRNPPPVEVGSFSHYLQRVYTSQLVQDFFHQQYHSRNQGVQDVFFSRQIRCSAIFTSDIVPSISFLAKSECETCVWDSWAVIKILVDEVIKVITNYPVIYGDYKKQRYHKYPIFEPTRTFSLTERHVSHGRWVFWKKLLTNTCFCGFICIWDARRQLSEFQGFRGEAEGWST